MSDDVADGSAGDDPDAPEPGEPTAETPASDEPTGDASPADEAPDGASDDGGRDLRRYLNYAAVAVLALLALVATLRFYFAASATIDTWVAREYRSLFQAAFNLVVLLAAVGGLALQLRRLDR